MLAGRAQRMHMHWVKCHRHPNKHLRRAFGAIRRAGLQPCKAVIRIHTTEQQAKASECRLIKRYGRIDTGTGVLCNLTEGGDGTKGYFFKHTPLTRAVIGEASKQSWQKDGYRRRRSISQRRYIETHPREHAARVQKLVRGWTPKKRAQHGRMVRRRSRENPLYGKSISEGLRRNKGFLRRARKRLRALNRDPDVVSRRSATCRKTWESRSLRKKMSEITKRFWNSPQGRSKKKTASRKTWRKKGYRRKMSKLRSAHYRNNPEARRRQSRKIKRIIAAYSPATKAALSRQRSAAATRRWRNRAWRRRTMRSLRKASALRYSSMTRLRPKA